MPGSPAMNRTATVKVGVLTVASLSLLVFVLLWLQGHGLGGGQSFDVLFKDVDGMRKGAPVQMMGIRVGSVDEVAAKEIDGKYYVQVNFTLNNLANFSVPKGSKLSIEQAGIVGEKFLEITPPPLRSVTMTTFTQPNQAITAGMPVKFRYYEGDDLDVGHVEKVSQSQDGNLIRHQLFYKITLPGAEMPDDPVYELTLDKNQHYFLLILPREPLIARRPDPNLKFTVENPLRIKRFLEIQMESAEALKLTNDKINQLLSDDTIDTLNNTLKNTEVLTARATEVIDTANALFRTSGKDLETLVKSSKELSENVTEVTRNLNDVIGDPKLKQDILHTVSSIDQSSRALSEILNDPALKETLAMTKETTVNANALMASLKKTAEDKDLQNRLDTSLTLLNDSLLKLSTVLGSVESLTNDDDQTLKGILEDTKATTENMKKITEKLNKHFTLFRLMF